MRWWPVMIQLMRKHSTSLHPLISDVCDWGEICAEDDWLGSEEATVRNMSFSHLLSTWFVPAQSPVSVWLLMMISTKWITIQQLERWIYLQFGLVNCIPLMPSKYIVSPWSLVSSCIVSSCQWQSAADSWPRSHRWCRDHSSAPCTGRGWEVDTPDTYPSSPCLESIIGMDAMRDRMMERSS